MSIFSCDEIGTKGAPGFMHYVMNRGDTTRYFAPVPEDVWAHRIGGYQVCEKWLKDRRERKLDLDDIRTYCRIVTALKLTIDIQEEIKGLYPEIEKPTLSRMAKE